jgi:hypothetical protein
MKRRALASEDMRSDSAKKRDMQQPQQRVIRFVVSVQREIRFVASVQRPAGDPLCPPATSTSSRSQHTSATQLVQSWPLVLNAASLVGGLDAAVLCSSWALCGLTAVASPAFGNTALHQPWMQRRQPPLFPLVCF